MIVSYSYYVMDHWVDVEYDDGWEEEEEEEEFNFVSNWYYPPYYADEEVTIWVDDFKDFDEPPPKPQQWYEPYMVETDNF